MTALPDEALDTLARSAEYSGGWYTDQAAMRKSTVRRAMADGIAP